MGRTMRRAQARWGLLSPSDLAPGLPGAFWEAIWGLPPSAPECTLCMAQAKGNPESSFNDENLRMVVSDLFSAGMVTTSTTLVWGLLFMIIHPDVQREPSPAQGPGGRRGTAGTSELA